MPRRYAREVWHRYPAALALVAIWAVVITRTGDLRAISAASSAGFLLVFAMVNLANERLADQTGSRRWLGVLGAGACLAALAAMLAQLVAQPSGGQRALADRAACSRCRSPTSSCSGAWRLAARGPSDSASRRGCGARSRQRGRGCWSASICWLAYVVLPWLWWFAERGQHPALDGLPKVTRNADGIPGDPINVGLVGTKAELIGAMLAAAGARPTRSRCAAAWRSPPAWCSTAPTWTPR